MWTPVRLNAGWSYPYGFGWVVNERRGHRMISHQGITGTELSRFPDDGLTVVVLTNLGATVSPSSRVNSWGLTYGVAGRYIKGLHVGPQKIEADPDPVLTARLREMLQHVAKGRARSDAAAGARHVHHADRTRDRGGAARHAQIVHVRDVR